MALRISCVMNTAIDIIQFDVMHKDAPYNSEQDTAKVNKFVVTRHLGAQTEDRLLFCGVQ